LEACSGAAAACDGKTIYVIGGVTSGGETLATVQSLQDIGRPTEHWATLPSRMWKERTGAAAVVLNGQIYVIGGVTLAKGIPSSLADQAWVPTHAHEYDTYAGYPWGEPTNTAEVFDPATGKWFGIPPMKNKRWGAAAAVMDGKLYVMGGFDQIVYWNLHSKQCCVPRQFILEKLDTVECFDPAKQEWTSVGSMNNPRSDAVAAVYNGCLYAIGGGNLARGALTSVECFDPDAKGWWANGSWTEVQPMMVAHRGAATAVLDGYLFVLGGSATTNIMDKASTAAVEQFDGLQWKRVQHMDDRRSGAAAAVLHRCLYVVGGVRDAACLSSTRKIQFQ